MPEPIDLALAGATCTLWPEGPLWNDAPAATIGQFRADSPEAGAALLTLACARLRELGCSAVLAPMNGDTWHSYRVVLDSDGSPPFALEPVSATLSGLAPGRFSSRSVVTTKVLIGSSHPVERMQASEVSCDH